jgi:hypothetical protein
MTIKNPYYHRDALTAPADFYGRRSQLRYIFGMLRGLQSCAIVGERKIGKSSLLKHIANPIVQATYDLPPERYSVTYFDLQGKANITPFEFWRQLLRSVDWRGDDAGWIARLRTVVDQQTIHLTDVEDIFYLANQHGHNLIFLLDEFEYTTRNPHFDLNFFGALRNLANNYNVAYVTASQRGLLDLHYDEKVVDSPFFNIFTEVQLGLFDPHEAIELLTQPLAVLPTSFTEEDRCFLLRLAGRFPFFLQVASYYLLDAYLQPASNKKEDVYAETKARFMTTAAPHFRYYWNHADDLTKATLAAMALLETQRQFKFRVAELSETMAYQVRQLIKIGFAERTVEQEERLFCLGFAEWIIDEITRYALFRDTKTDFEAWLGSAQLKGLDRRVRDFAERSAAVFLKVNPRYWQVLLGLILNSKNLDHLGRLFNGA